MLIGFYSIFLPLLLNSIFLQVPLRVSHPRSPPVLFPYAKWITSYTVRHVLLIPLKVKKVKAMLSLSSSTEGQYHSHQLRRYSEAVIPSFVTLHGVQGMSEN